VFLVAAVTSLRTEFDRRRPDFPAGTPFWKDRSFEILLERCPQLRGITDFLQTEGEDARFEGEESIERLQSSYKDHGYGRFLYALVRFLKPARCVEFGVLQGFSLLTVAAALRDNGSGHIDGFDLFEDYPYTHEPYARAAARIERSGLRDWAQIHRAGAVHVSGHFARLDYLHVDLSNDGDIYRRTFEEWAGKVGRAIVLEGGSAERDRVDWMIRYRKSSIAPVIEELRRRHADWTIVVLEPYPSLTVAIRSAGQTVPEAP